jgi:uncharacterized protein (TIGR02145 family)
MRKIFLLILIKSIFLDVLVGQELFVSYTSAKQNGETIEVNYTLTSNKPVKVELFVSNDGGENFMVARHTNPLKKVKGDVGDSIKTGTKTIVWFPKEEQYILPDTNVVFMLQFSIDQDPKLLGYIFMNRIKAPLAYNKLLPETFIDNRDNKVYKYQKIGNLTVMVQNLSFIPDSGVYWEYTSTDLKQKYGCLYDWETAKSVCPDGWHLPTKEEYEILTDYFGGVKKNCFKALIEAGYSGFSALMGNYALRTNKRTSTMGTYAREYPEKNEYREIGVTGFYWTNSESEESPEGARYVLFSTEGRKVSIGTNYRESGHSVRCFKDTITNNR